MNKTNIKNFAVWAREKLIADITYKAGMLGITDSGISEKLPQSTADLHFYDIGTKNYSEVTGVEIKQRDALVKAIKTRERSFKNYKEAFDNVVEEVAYTWFNRLIAIRFMEVNEYLPSGVRVLSSENKFKTEPDFVTSPFDTDLEFTPYEQDRIIQLKDENKLDELFRMLFIKQCNKFHEILPELFEKTDDFSELLLTISFTDIDGIVYKLTHDIDEDDFNVEKEGQVEIIGWMYQYYNTEPKDAVFANLKKNIKISKEHIPAATQLFTPDWIVRYMVENSLGRLWLEGHSDSNVKAQWQYYLEEAEQEESVKAQLEELRREYKNLSPEDIKFIDPCMGSGHILVYAFDVFMQIYSSYGYGERDAAQLIVQKNLYGLDIDERAYQLAYFAVMMKARQYDRRFFTREIKPNLAHFQGFDSVQPDYARGAVRELAERFIHCDTYGSLIEMPEIKGIEEAAAEFEGVIGLDVEKVERMLPIYKILSQKYDVVCTNPPYMGNGPVLLSNFLISQYAEEKYDLYAAFIMRCIRLSKQIGFSALITGDSWMFLPSFEKMRENLMLKKNLINMAHMGFGAFDNGFGTTAFIISNLYFSDYKTKYERLAEIKESELKRKALLNIVINGGESINKKNNIFRIIDGSPFVYWMNENVINSFHNSSLSSYATTKAGIVTGNNDYFIHFWYEVNNCDIDYHSKKSDVIFSKWVPSHKGGGFNKYYGNNDYVMRLCDLWSDRYYTSNMRRGDTNYYYIEGITWSTLSNKLAFRYSPYGFVYETKGSMCFPQELENLYYILGLLNSSLCNYILNILCPTLDYNRSSLLKLPCIISQLNKEEIDCLVKNNVELARVDWDSFETSWDFKRHPLLDYMVEDEREKPVIKYNEDGLYSDTDIEIYLSIESAFNNWSRACDERFNQLKQNEEELNRIFIDIYGLQDELTPEVEDKDVTVRKADLQREIKSLISYAVGCMFGRYSLDVEGLVYAGGEWDSSKYTTFIPDADNCIPVTDEEYFEDDIVGLFCGWLKKVYGRETLEENLDFIASALGNKGKTSREVIRNYFLNDFIKDHIKIYQKRPIYWLFDSGKQNGFKALVYMHRWNADTIGNMRVEYLHRIQRVYDKEIERMQEVIDNSNDNKEISAASKRKEKLQKQIKETKDFDAIVAHLALSRIDIDLDDGVKVNYEKVQTAPDGKKMQILAKI